jgi:hypothetical protein
MSEQSKNTEKQLLLENLKKIPYDSNNLYLQYLEYFLEELLILIMENKKILDYNNENIIETNIDPTTILKPGTWIARPLDLWALNLVANKAIEHHGLVTDLDDNKNITITHFYGSFSDKSDASIQKIKFEDFLLSEYDYKFHVYHPDLINNSFKYDRQINNINQALDNASKKLGEKGYNILFNNCEKFVIECLFKHPFGSLQSNRFFQYIDKLIIDKITGKHLSFNEYEEFYKELYQKTFVPFTMYQYDYNTKTLNKF